MSYQRHHTIIISSKEFHFFVTTQRWLTIAVARGITGPDSRGKSDIVTDNQPQKNNSAPVTTALGHLY